ncbi:GTPase [Micrococcus luteus]|nr:GTPase [Micrococcus luteus]
MALDILYVRPGGSGWGPVTELVALTARVFDARVISVDDRGEVSRLRKVAAGLPRRKPRNERHLLVIAANPAMVAYAARAQLWLPGYTTTAAWVIDSFWTDRTPRLLRGRPHIDRLFITDPDLTVEWGTLTGGPVSVLPWGADTARFPDTDALRDVDVLRLGRQPAAWSDDEQTAADAARAGLRFAGRPPMSSDPAENQANVRAALMQARIVLAFSNLVSPAPYTHPTRDYLTGRWMDALAAGCLIAGTAPRAAAATLWDGATIEISPTDRSAAWPVLADAAASWTPNRARAQQRRARVSIDWRLRLRALCREMGWNEPDTLSVEIDLLG